MENAREKVLETIGTVFEVDPSEISEETTLSSDLDATSLTRFMLAAMLSEMIDREVDYATVSSFLTVADVIRFAESNT